MLLDWPGIRRRSSSFPMAVNEAAELSSKQYDNAGMTSQHQTILTSEPKQTAQAGHAAQVRQNYYW
jgi:hypothetical protein